MAASTSQLHVDRSTWKALLELATKEVFDMMVNSTVEASEPDAGHRPEFTAMVGLAGQICGVLSIRCATKTAALMASKMLGLPLDQADQECWDAAAEVCNMVAGNFKSKLSGGSHCMLSVPTVIIGADYEMRSMADGETIEAWMSFEGHPLWIVLELHS
jgi:chemotaxis protein CheX